ncbi:hypothetical protein ASG89_33990 [Paenibacillus sp. Soil766]|nr:hypothetical protein ASG89_33990 [Paenibacillus sp. Soil766]
MNISLAIIIDHNSRSIIYGETAIITQLGQCFGQETRKFTLEIRILLTISPNSDSRASGLYNKKISRSIR